MKIQSLQILRGIAATAVVFHHALRALTSNSNIPPETFNQYPEWLITIGSCGVDIFFVLSGFLMHNISKNYTTHSNRRKFFILRITRIWPMYFISTILVLLIIYIGYLFNKNNMYDFSLIRIASIFFIPSYNQKGLLQPILGVGWTLNYEFLFYTCFALLINTRKIVFNMFIMLLCIILLGKTVFHGTAIGDFFGNTIIIEFLFGMIISKFYKNRIFGINYAIYYLAIGSCLIYFYSKNENENIRFMTAGTGSALLFLTLLHLNNGNKITNLLKLLGDASYSIYLFHIIVIYNFAMPIIKRTNIQSFYILNLMPFILVAISLYTGYFIYKKIEYPLTKKITNSMRSCI